MLERLQRCCVARPRPSETLTLDPLTCRAPARAACAWRRSQARAACGWRSNTLNLALLDTQGTWTCGMCLEEVAGARCVRPAPCAHFFCAACVRGQLAVHVADGALDALRCPEPDCRTPYLREARGAARNPPLRPARTLRRRGRAGAA
jgi:hypothetical protein